jgi:hypothetical protein
MDRSVEEARHLMSLEEAKLRRLSYDEIQRLNTPLVKDLIGNSGNTYVIGE